MVPLVFSGSESPSTLQSFPSLLPLSALTSFRGQWKKQCGNLADNRGEIETMDVQAITPRPRAVMLAILSILLVSVLMVEAMSGGTRSRLSSVVLGRFIVVVGIRGVLIRVV